MVVGSIKAGYLGIASIDGTMVRCQDFSMNPKQEPKFYDHIFGLRDAAQASLFGGKGDIGALNPQKILWRPGVKIYQGGMSFPLTERIGTLFFDLARTGNDFNLEFAYDCESGRLFEGCKVNSYTFTVTAGDLATVNVDIIGMKASPTGGLSYDVDEKLLTWDDFQIASASLDTSIQSLTLNVNNNCKPVYTAGGNAELKLNPIRIRVGMQEVTGSIAIYNKGAPLRFMEDIAESTPLTITSSSGERSLNVIFKPQERSASIGPVISQLSFVGVDHAMG